MTADKKHTIEVSANELIDASWEVGTNNAWSFIQYFYYGMWEKNPELIHDFSVELDRRLKAMQDLKRASGNNPWFTADELSDKW